MVYPFGWEGREPEGGREGGREGRREGGKEGEKGH